VNLRESELQGRWLLEKGAIARPALSAAWARISERPGQDLCAVLQVSGLISPELAASARQAARRAITAPAGPPNASEPSIQVVPQEQSQSRELASAEVSLSQAIRIPGFTILRELGRGAMGVVFHGREESSGREVAIKQQLGQGSAQEQTRFEREYKALALLHHPNVVAAVQSGTVDGRPFFAMEFVKGQDFEARLQSDWRLGQPCPLERIVELGAALADALQHCHERGVIHRDIKPTNVLIEEATGRFVLTDFGLMRASRAVDMSASLQGSLTATTDMVGTPAFMSPEQIQPKGPWGEVGEKADIWAFGATLHYALTSRPPFKGASAVEMMLGVLQEDYSGPSEKRPDTPSWLHELCLRCLNKQQDSRPTASDVLAVFDSHLEISSTDSNQKLSDSIGLELPQRPKSSLSRKILLFTLLLTLPPLAYLLWPAPARLLESPVLPPITNQRQLTITGKINKSDFNFQFANTSIRSDSKGEFSTTIQLTEGAQEFELNLGPDSDPASHLKFNLIADFTPPALHWHDGTQKEGGSIVIPVAGLHGRIEDRSLPAIIKVSDQTIETDSSGSFFWIPSSIQKSPDIEANESRDYSFTVIDQAGNSKTISVATISESFHLKILEERRAAAIKIEEETKKAEMGMQRLQAELIRQRALQTLQTAIGDTRLWLLMTDPDAKIAIADYILKILGPAFGLSKPRRCRAIVRRRELESQLPMFQHIASGIEFTIVPGFNSEYETRPFPQVRDSDAVLLSIWRESEFNLDILLSSIDLMDDWALPRVQSILGLTKDSDRASVKSALREKGESASSLFKQLYKENSDYEKKAVSFIPSGKTIKTEGILVSINEISRSQWAKLTGTELKGEPDQPMTSISARQILDTLKEKKLRFRLPSLHEYLLFCGRTEYYEYWWQETFKPGEADWTLESSEGRLHSIFEHDKQRNIVGLADLQGNAAEIAITKTSGGAILHAFGGSYQTPRTLSRIGARRVINQTDSDPSWGFRLVIPIPGFPDSQCSYRE
jgi:serine/threonine protein kinase